MKKGKTSKIQGFKTAKILYGTVDSVEFKSMYLNIQTWVEPQLELENWNRVTLNLSRKVKHTIYNNINTELFEKKFIVDLDLRSSGLQMDKKSFLNLEINFFLNQKDIDFKSNNVKEILKNLTKKIIQENLTNNYYFNFSLTKKSDKLINIKT
jgi:hypothetical protein